jgi:DNA-binding response OmpR family regulator
MAKILMLTNSMGASADVLPALALLQHDVRILPAEVSVLIDAPTVDCIFVDARRDLPNTKAFTKLITTTGVSTPIVVITTEGGLSAVNADWQIADVILDTAGPAEVDARIRIVIGKDSYTAKIKGRTLDLTFKEFELLKYLTQHPGRVFSRSQLLQEIWGYDYFGGTRTVDVHIRRLRSKLGPEFEAIIDTVRNVGYRFSSNNSAGSNQSTADLS